MSTALGSLELSYPGMSKIPKSKQNNYLGYYAYKTKLAL